MKGLLKLVFFLIVTVAILLLGLRGFDLLVFSDFYKKSVSIFQTPGLNEGYVPQGFDYDAEEKTYLLTGYMSNDKASRVYVVDEKGNARCTELKKANGDDYTGHTGGIAYYGDYLYITGSKGIDVFSYADVREGKTSIQCMGTVLTYIDPAYCTVHDGYLYAGSFADYDEELEDYEETVTPSGDLNRSIITVFRLDPNQEFGIDPAPKAVITATDIVQGMCFTDQNEMILSTSRGLAQSKLYIYNLSDLAMESDYHFQGTFKGKDFSFEGLKRYHLESEDLVDTIIAPPMSEEILYMNGRIYVMNESACNKYIFGKFTTGFYTYAYTYRK